MHLQAGIPTGLVVAGHILAWPLVGWVAYHCLRRKVDWARLNIVAAGLVLVLALWQLGTVVGDVVRVHVLGTTWLTLVCGWRTAVLGQAAVVSLSLAWAGDWSTIGITILLAAALPAMVTSMGSGLIWRYLPRHLMVFIFLCGFGLAGVSMLLVGGAITGLLWTVSDPSYTAVTQATLLLAYPEAFVNGMLIAVLSVYRPNDVRYLDKSVFDWGDDNRE